MVLREFCFMTAWPICTAQSRWWGLELEGHKTILISHSASPVCGPGCRKKYIFPSNKNRQIHRSCRQRWTFTKNSANANPRFIRSTENYWVNWLNLEVSFRRTVEIYNLNPNCLGQIWTTLFHWQNATKIHVYLFPTRLFVHHRMNANGNSTKWFIFLKQ